MRTTTFMAAGSGGQGGFAPGQTALVLVDVSSTHFAGRADEAVQLRALLGAARAARVFTIFLTALEEDEPFAPGLAPAPGEHEFVVRAPAAGPFGTSTFHLLLRANGITDVVLAGSDAQLAVSCAARDASARGLRVGLASDAATLFSVVTRWIDEPQGPRGWQPEVKHASWLRTLEQRLNPAHTALVLIDVQNDFVSAQGATGRRESMPLVDAAAARIPVLLADARAAGCTIVHVTAEYGQHVRHIGSPYRLPSKRTREGAVWSVSAGEMGDDQEFPANEVEVCLPGGWGALTLASVAALPGELRITKHRFSAFIDTPLETMLRARGIRTLIFAGVTTNCCIESSVRDASMLDFYVVVAEDGVGVKNSVEALHEASLEQMRTYFALVEPIDRIGDALRTHHRIEEMVS
jgi:nicotinamidase-related amidase